MADRTCSVVLMSILRLWTALRQNKDTFSSVDFTWWNPPTLIISCLEVDFAIMCASMPIFWPVIVASLAQIFVTREVRVTSHQQLPEDGGLDFEMGRPNSSLKSSSSQEGLTRVQELSKTDYSDQLIVDYVTGKVPESGTVAVGRTKSKREWMR